MRAWSRHSSATGDDPDLIGVQVLAVGRAKKSLARALVGEIRGSPLSVCSAGVAAVTNVAAACTCGCSNARPEPSRYPINPAINATMATDGAAVLIRVMVWFPVLEGATQCMLPVESRRSAYP